MAPGSSCLEEKPAFQKHYPLLYSTKDVSCTEDVMATTVFMMHVEQLKGLVQLGNGAEEKKPATTPFRKLPNSETQAT